ncbi:MAG: hypothetical protein ACOYT4_03270 [Nanoarchaeota archaeon]
MELEWKYDIKIDANRKFLESIFLTNPRNLSRLLNLAIDITKSSNNPSSIKSYIFIDPNLIKESFALELSTINCGPLANYNPGLKKVELDSIKGKSYLVVPALRIYTKLDNLKIPSKNEIDYAYQNALICLEHDPKMIVKDKRLSNPFINFIPNPEIKGFFMYQLKTPVNEEELKNAVKTPELKNLLLIYKKTLREVNQKLSLTAMHKSIAEKFEETGAIKCDYIDCSKESSNEKLTISDKNLEYILNKYPYEINIKLY